MRVVEALTQCDTAFLRAGDATVFVPWDFALAQARAEDLGRLIVRLSRFAEAVFGALARNDGVEDLRCETRQTLRVLEDVMGVGPGALVGAAQDASRVAERHGEVAPVGAVTGGDHDQGLHQDLEHLETGGLPLCEAELLRKSAAFFHAGSSLDLTAAETVALRALVRKLDAIEAAR
jgi:hypothetical protein